MTCDDAFDQLTTYGGSNDSRLTSHLAGCPRCRAMADTLAPAIALFTESANQAATAPTPATITIARQAAGRLGRRAGATRDSASRVRRGLSLLTAALGGAACCFAAIQFSGSSHPGSGTMAVCPRKSPVSMEWMERHAVPVAIACVACHPTGEISTVTPMLIRPVSSLGRPL